MSAILSVRPLHFPWDTPDPFLFCVHHDDHYPAGDPEMGPQASLTGRRIGSDFSGKDGWSMYHGSHVPGFPRHPHRGFETVTVVRRGLIDHSDSLGGTARYGHGDVQWMTAGKGIEHCEMFPLVRTDGDNPTELFQIWLNLPRKDKFAEPAYTMLWHEQIPAHRFRDEDGRGTELVTIAGAYGGEAPPPPPPESWASRAEAEVAIWTVKMEAGARWTLPAAGPGLNRALYAFLGGTVRVDGQEISTPRRVMLRSDQSVELLAGAVETEFLLLQGRPLNEPVVQHGPFVMNTEAEVRQAYMDYQRTRFGQWPFRRDDPVHPRTQGRFARHPDGRVEERS